MQEFREIIAYSSRKPPTYTLKDEQDDIIYGKFYQEDFDQSQLAIELVFSASAQLLPDNTLSFSTDFLPEHLNLESQCEVAIFELSYPSIYQNVTEEFKFFDENRQKFTIWNLIFTLPSRRLLKPSTH